MYFLKYDSDDCTILFLFPLNAVTNEAKIGDLLQKILADSSHLIWLIGVCSARTKIVVAIKINV